jgi:glycosyltransferase involved in cell wall biosynthesis
LLIIGDGISLDDLKKIVFDNKLERFVDFIKWPGHENLGPYLKIADICISPQPQNEHWNNSIPHKLFEYMSQLKPVLVADAIPLKRIIKETNAGMFYKSGDARDFAQKVELMLKIKEDWGKNGRNAVVSKYNWKVDSKELLRVYDSFNFV